MRADIVLVEELQLKYVSYYTIQVEGKASSEFEDFQSRMRTIPKDLRQLRELNRLISKIGRVYGAQDHFFKRERYADRLPPPTYRFFDSDGENDFGLRLYCLKVNDNCVILLNGDRKTAQRVQDCPKCAPHFIFANKVSDAFFRDRQAGLIDVDGFDIFTEEGYVLNVN